MLTSDGYRQRDNFPSDLGMMGIPIPGLVTLSNMIKAVSGIGYRIIGSFLINRGWFGP